MKSPVGDADLGNLGIDRWKSGVVCLMWDVILLMWDMMVLIVGREICFAFVSDFSLKSIFMISPIFDGLDPSVGKEDVVGSMKDLSVALFVLTKMEVLIIVLHSIRKVVGHAMFIFLVGWGMMLVGWRGIRSWRGVSYSHDHSKHKELE